MFDIYGASEYLALTHGAAGGKNDDLPQFSLGICEKMLEKTCGFWGFKGSSAGNWTGSQKNMWVSWVPLVFYQSNESLQ